MNYIEALQLIATGPRPDGTWDRDREACRQLAAEALGFHNNGASMTTATEALRLAREALKMMRDKLTPQVNGADETCFVIGMRKQITWAEAMTVGDAIREADAALAALPAGEPAAAPAPAVPADVRRPFFAYDPDNGVEWYETQAEALEHAVESLRHYRETARCDGEWPDDTDTVCIGVVTHAAKAEGNEADGFDYSLTTATPQEAPAVQAEPVPIGYARPEAVQALQERQAGWCGRPDYLHTRREPEDGYTAPLYAAPTAQPPAVQAEPLNGIKATMFHDEGAIAQCQNCKRYTLNPKALADSRQPVCDCGKQHYWSGSFKKPGPDAQWFGAAPTAQPAPRRYIADMEDTLRQIADALGVPHGQPEALIAAAHAAAHPAPQASAPSKCPTHETTSGDHVICRRCGETWPAGAERACVRAEKLLRRAAPQAAPAPLPLTDERIAYFARHAADRIPASNYEGRVLHAVRMAEATNGITATPEKEPAKGEGE